MLTINSVLRLAGWLLLVTAVSWAGDLEPPAPPQVGTMKTLQQIEPRTPIHARDLPLTIDTPGSYYLAENADCCDTAITVAADDVTIDLAGFCLSGHGIGTGIALNGRSNVEVRGGTVRGFLNGIYDNNAAAKSYCIIDVRVKANASNGIVLEGEGHLVRDCIVCDNGFITGGSLYGVKVGNGAAVIGNSVSNNGEWSFSSHYAAVETGEGCTVIGNTVFKNGAYYTARSWGMLLGHYNLVDQNTVYGNSHHNGLAGTNCELGTNVGF